MKTINAYELTNGEILKNKEEAIKRQKKIDFEKAIIEFANEIGYSDESDLISRTILDYADKLQKIFDAR